MFYQPPGFRKIKGDNSYGGASISAEVKTGSETAVRVIGPVGVLEAEVDMLGAYLKRGYVGEY